MFVFVFFLLLCMHVCTQRYIFKWNQVIILFYNCLYNLSCHRHFPLLFDNLLMHKKPPQNLVAKTTAASPILGGAYWGQPIYAPRGISWDGSKSGGCNSGKTCSLMYLAIDAGSWLGLSFGMSPLVLSMWPGFLLGDNSPWIFHVSAWSRSSEQKHLQPTFILYFIRILSL